MNHHILFSMTEQQPSARFTAIVRHNTELIAQAQAVTDPEALATIEAQLRANRATLADFAEQRETFDRLPSLWHDIYGDGPGFVALFSGRRGEKALEHPRSAYFAWPSEASKAVPWAEGEAGQERELYQCAHLVTTWRRRQEDAAPIYSLWADIDHDALPEGIAVPGIIVESSPGRLQAYWHLAEPLPPATAAAYNRKLAEALGADRSGWDLTQLLRLPGGFNHKYSETPLVRVRAQTGVRHHVAGVFSAWGDLPLFQPVVEPIAARGTRSVDAPTGEAPLPANLTAQARRIIAGEQPKLKPDGSVDRSGSLVQIARVLLGARLPRDRIVAMLAERDRALGWRKYAEREDARAQYERIVDFLSRSR
jgi:hypothetical protein